MKTADNLKILLMSDYSNFHSTLAKGLRKLGCNVTLISDGSTFMECDRDIDISRRDGKLGGLKLAYNILLPLHSKLKGYDIVAFRDPNFLDLKPSRNLWFLRRFFKENKACFLSYLTTDVPFLDMLEAHDSPLRYSEWFVDGHPNRLKVQDPRQWERWHSQDMKKLNEFFFSNIDGAVTALYEYHLSAERLLPKERIAYGGIPIDTESILPVNSETPRKVRIFLGRDYRRKLQKGSDLLEIAAKNVVEKYPDKAELIILENKSHSEYMQVMRSCHLVLDQIYSYTPATMALEAMASGIPTVTGAEPEFYEFIGEKENFPIINAPIELEPLQKCIEEIILKPSDLPERGRRSRVFVEKHHSLPVVASRFLDHWMKVLDAKFADSN